MTEQQGEHDHILCLACGKMWDRLERNQYTPLNRDGVVCPVCEADYEYIEYCEEELRHGEMKPYRVAVEVTLIFPLSGWATSFVEEREVQARLATEAVEIAIAAVRAEVWFKDGRDGGVKHEVSIKRVIQMMKVLSPWSAEGL